MGLFRQRPTLSKICHTYPTMMKLGTVILYQNIYKFSDIPLSSHIAFYHQKSVNFATSVNSNIDCILVNNF